MESEDKILDQKVSNLFGISASVWEVILAVSEEISIYYRKCILDIQIDAINCVIANANGVLQDLYQTNPSLELLSEILQKTDGKPIFADFNDVSFCIRPSENLLLEIAAVILPRQMLS